MKSFLAAIKAVSRVEIALPDRKIVVPKAWQMVVARALLALAWGLAGLLVLWLLPDKGLVGVALATLAVVAARWYLCRPEEREGMMEVYRMVAKSLPQEDLFARQAIQNVIMLIRPILIFLLLWQGCWAWLVIAGTLGMAAALTVSGLEKGQCCWGAAAAISLVIGALVGRLSFASGNLFLMAVIATIVSWLLAKVLEGREEMTANTTLFIGETAILLIGIC
jgi:hypothetical protein